MGRRQEVKGGKDGLGNAGLLNLKDSEANKQSLPRTTRLGRLGEMWVSLLIFVLVYFMLNLHAIMWGGNMSRDWQSS